MCSVHAASMVWDSKRVQVQHGMGNMLASWCRVQANTFLSCPHSVGGVSPTPCPCRQQHLLATSQLQNMAKLLEDAASGKYKRAVDPSSTAAATSSSAAPDTKQAVVAELAKAAAKQAKLVDILHSLQQQVPELQDDLGRVLLHASATSVWLQPQGVSEVH